MNLATKAISIQQNSIILELEITPSLVFSTSLSDTTSTFFLKVKPGNQMGKGFRFMTEQRLIFEQIRQKFHY